MQVTIPSRANTKLKPSNFMMLFLAILLSACLCSVNSVNFNVGQGSPIAFPQPKSASASAVNANIQQTAAAAGKVKSASGFGWNWNNWSSWGWHTPQKQCPSQIEYNDAVRLSSNPNGYPVIQITAELTARTTLFACLQRQVVLPTDPTVPYDPVIGTALNTCPVSEQRLWSYTSVTNLGRCWVLQNFQEPVHFVTCLTKTCNHCSTYRSNYREPTCLKIYRYVLVYAYCEGLPNNARIITERILVPQECSCRSVECYGSWK